MSNAAPANYPRISGWTKATDGTLIYFQWSSDGLGRLEEVARAADWASVAKEADAWHKAKGR